ncbi:MAG: hypothetical protein FD123_1269 [Bacteroidetes bacterium]|nr:MAG: hypothetical protein FD123_1269 [Bacteroidota bacterium]
MRKGTVRKGHAYHTDGLNTVGIVLGVASVGFILYNVLSLLFS